MDESTAIVQCGVRAINELKPSSAWTHGQPFVERQGRSAFKNVILTTARQSDGDGFVRSRLVTRKNSILRA